MKEAYNIRLSDCQQEIDRISDWISRNKLDSNVRYLVFYAVIKACGTIEAVFKEIVFEYLSDNTKNDTRNYLEKKVIESSINPTFGNICNLLDQIDPNKRVELEEAVKKSGEKGNLNSLVSLRNDFAHGRNISATINDVINYYRSGKAVLLLLDEVIDIN